MPVKLRQAKGRRPTFPPGVLSQFAQLDATPRRLRRAQWFQQAEEELHSELGLSVEWLCSQVSVLDRERSHHSPGSPQADDWRVVRGVRLALLAAVGQSRARGQRQEAPEPRPCVQLGRRVGSRP